MIEVKGAVEGNDMVLTGSKLKSKVGGEPLIMTSREWISRNNKARYLKTMANAADPKINKAATLLDKIAKNRAPYESIIVGHGSGASSRFGKIDETLGKLRNDDNAAKVDMILIRP